MGGQELQLLQQAQALKTQGHAPRIVCRPNSRIAEEARALGLEVDLLTFRNAVHGPSVLGLARLLRKHRPVALVCHSGHDSNVCAITTRALACLGLLAPRPKLIRMRTYLPGPVNAFTYNTLFDQTFTPSQALRAQLLQNSKVRPQKVGVLYPIMNFDALSQAAQQPLPAALSNLLPQHGPIIVHAAMLREEKGHVFMLGVIKALVNRFPRLLYIAAGEGPNQAAIQAEVERLGLQQHVRLTGMLNPVAPLIARADVLVMPSHQEPLGMSQIEALGLGVPVVVSDAGGLPETVQHGQTGVICPHPATPGAQQAWAQAMAHVVLNPAQAQHMALLGKQSVRAQFGQALSLEFLLGNSRV